jgi:O-acetyl-ADP-ribose deacetylase (regulator of RNase III)
MIHYTKGDIFEAQTDAIINTVNTVGVMGKGIALQFKQRFPKNFLVYKNACAEQRLSIGQLLITEQPTLFFKYIINFPTKINWIHASKYEYIESGLVELVQKIKDLGITSIAIPPLGAGNGKLDWEKVKPIIEQHLAALPHVQVYIYEPQAEFEARDNKKNTSASTSLTPIRAMLLRLMFDYQDIDESLNLLVTQKLAYFMQRFGEPMRLQYSKGWYGPYAPNLNKVLQSMNGTFIQYEAQYDKPNTPIRIIESQKERLSQTLEFLSEPQKVRIALLKTFMKGFETPFSLELLATVDWILRHEPTQDADRIHVTISNWTQRKAEIIKPYHVKMAFEHLKSYQSILYPN